MEFTLFCCNPTNDKIPLGLIKDDSRREGLVKPKKIALTYEKQVSADTKKEPFKIRYDVPYIFMILILF